MDSLRKEIESELVRTRLDKTRLYTLLLKLIDNCGGGSGGAGPAGPQGVPGPVGARGPTGAAGAAGAAGECKCKCISKEATPAKTPAKKVPIKKKVAVSA